MLSHRPVGVAIAACLVAACGATVPRAELDRCSLGAGDHNDAFEMRQPVACRSVASRLAADGRRDEALAYAQRACQLQDGPGCEKYLALVRARPDMPPDDLQRARAAGEKACSGMVVGTEGVDARGSICARTAELYLDKEPRSSSDAGRLFALACRLGDRPSCSHARGLGVSPEGDDLVAKKQAAKVAPPVAPPPPAQPAPTATAAPAALVPACHEMRTCVELEVHQRNGTEVVGTLTNRCDGPVDCAFCPVRRDQVDKTACRSITIAPGQSKAGRESGLWYDGYTAIAYDCSAAGDGPACLAM